MSKKQYDVVVIGGGIIGCALAFELVKRKAGRVLLLEKKYLSAGATGRCNAGFREFWSTPLYAELSRQSIEILDHINAYTGYPYDCEVIHNGYYFPMYSKEQLDHFNDILEFQKKYGIETTVLSKQETKEMIPEMNVEGIVGTIWSKNDGHVDPFHCTFAYALGAQKMGVDVLVETEVIDFLVENQKIKGVVTDRGVFETEYVYNCTNTFAPELAQKVGDELPIKKEFRQTVITEKFHKLGKDGAMLPLIINMKNGSWIKQTPCGTLMMGKAENPPFENLQLEWDFMEKAAAYNTKWFPAIRNAKIIRQYEGVYDISPDYAPIIGESKNAEGLVHVCGFSGHGFMIAPKFCQIVADYHCGKKNDINAEQFKLERFQQGKLLLDAMAI